MQIWLCFLQGVGYWQFWQIVWCWDGFDGIDQQMEVVFQVDQVGDDCWVGLSIEDQVCWICFVVDVQWLNVEDWFFDGGDCWVYFQYV